MERILPGVMMARSNFTNSDDARNEGDDRRAQQDEDRSQSTGRESSNGADGHGHGVNGHYANGTSADSHHQSDKGESADGPRATSGSAGGGDLPSPPGETPFAVRAQLLFPDLPTANGKDILRIKPSQDEVQALEYLMEQLSPSFSEDDRTRLLKAYLVASYAHRTQQRRSGEAYMTHPIAVTTILAELNLDADTLSASLLHDVAEDTEFSIEYLEEQFGPVIAKLVDGVTKLKRINELSKVKNSSSGDRTSSMSDAKAESLRKMFLAMVDDIRVVLIKLADRLHNMRTLESQPTHKRKRIARETLDVFAPLANRLGIWQMKWELEDLSFRYVQPETYRELADFVDHKRSAREKWVTKTEEELKTALKEAGVQAEISGRPKHIYSIWKKMQRKGVDFSQIYDIHGFRVIVETEAQCYAALGVVHTLWRPIPGEFDDYIANPKDNMYRSLHTAVLSPDNGRPMEVQIRTKEMHRIAELGIAAHWSYKENRVHDKSFQQKINWLRQLMEWRHDVTDANAFMDGMMSDVFNDRVYVFTPKGDVIDLPAGATPIDLAYAIHTELGHRCRGANVNGQLKPLDYKLKTGDQVSVVTAKRGGPSRDWLNPNLEYVATQRARSKIRTWLRRQNRDDNIQRGRHLLEKELKRLSITESFESVMKLFNNYDKVDDFLAAIGYGEINSQHIAQKLLDKERQDQQEEEWRKGLKLKDTSSKRVATGSFQVQGVDGLLTHLGRCCNPVPGDQIVGYVTRGRGITVHRKTCPNVADTFRKGREKQLIDVQWKTQQEQTFPVKIQVSAYDRAGLVRDVASLVADDHINMLSIEALTGQKNNIAIINATLEIEDASQLTRILTKIDRLPNVIEVRRKVG
jgi:RelA/SpoT family (p)ppGpp synthetase